MRLRARHIDKLEVFTDITVGLVINYTLTYWLLHTLGYEIEHSQNAVISGVLFVFAFIRKYTIRRTFSNIIKRIYQGRDYDQSDV